MELENPCWLPPPPTFASGDLSFSLLPSPKLTAAPSNLTVASTSTPSRYSTLSYGKGEQKLVAVGLSAVRMLPCCQEKGEGWKRLQLRATSATTTWPSPPRARRPGTWQRNRVRNSPFRACLLDERWQRRSKQTDQTQRPRGSDGVAES